MLKVVALAREVCALAALKKEICPADLVYLEHAFIVLDEKEIELESIAPVDPRVRWCLENKEKLAPYHGWYAAIHAERGIITVAREQKVFGALWERVPQDIRHECLLINVAQVL